MRSLRPALVLALLCGCIAPLYGEPLPDTRPLTTEGDLAAQMVSGIDKYLMRELAASVAKRKAYWKPDYSSPEAYNRSVEPNRQHLRHILGMVDKRLPVDELEIVETASAPSLVAVGHGYSVYAVRWPVLEGVYAEGLLLEPGRGLGSMPPRGSTPVLQGTPVASIVAIPDADWTPEMLVGLAPGVPKESQFARRLAERGCRVLVPALINRRDTFSGNPALGRMTNQPQREFIYRQAYEMGRHIIGYEVQKVLAAVDWLSSAKEHAPAPIGVYGYGEGGMLALYSGALDPRIRLTVVSGYFGPREGVWQQPIYRNVFGLLREFGDAELADLIAPRALWVEAGRGPEVAGPPAPHDGRGGAAPGRLTTVSADDMRREASRSKAHGKLGRLGNDGLVRIKVKDDSLPTAARTADDMVTALALATPPPPPQPPPDPPKDRRKDFNPAARQHRQFQQLVDFTQKVMRDSEYRRAASFWAKLDTSSVEKYRASTAPFRKELWEEVIGKLPNPTEPMNPRTRLLYDEPKYRAYEVTLDLYPDVFAYGILCVPKDLKPGEKRPVVVCQHGLEGRPQDVVNPRENTHYYHSFGSRLAERGYVVYAPQNPYIGQDKFRVLQRKANPLGLSLFSFIIRQHERTLDFLAGLPFVDAERMAFYGLSYGGKTAMRVPAVLPRYCLSICSGDFNEWTWKNASVDFPGSYMFSGEYEMPEFNLGETLVYAEMAALIAPRPFMVERGHNDGVGIDEWVSYEYAKVRRLYSRLKLPDETEIEYFPGPHEIHGVGTFAFLQKHLNWPK